LSENYKGRYLSHMPTFLWSLVDTEIKTSTNSILEDTLVSTCHSHCFAKLFRGLVSVVVPNLLLVWNNDKKRWVVVGWYWQVSPNGINATKKYFEFEGHKETIKCHKNFTSLGSFNHLRSAHHAFNNNTGEFLFLFLSEKIYIN